MIAVISVTENDLYAMPLPFVVYSWIKIGCTCIVFTPKGNNPKIELAKKYFSDYVSYYEFDCEERRIPTYSQVSRLMGAVTDNVEDDDVLITGDSDLCVFGDFFEQLKDGRIHVVGADLTPDEQYPMCFAAMPVKKWKKVYNLTKGYQEHLEEIINPIQSTNLRGTAWCLDQFLLKQGLDKSGEDIVFHNRSNGITQFAQHRADRDSWYNFDPYNIIDAHLPRPLTEEDNFNKVYELFRIKYPNDNLQWMIDFKTEYLKLL